MSQRARSKRARLTQGLDSRCAVAARLSPRRSDEDRDWDLDAIETALAGSSTLLEGLTQASNRLQAIAGVPWGRSVIGSTKAFARVRSSGSKSRTAAGRDLSASAGFPAPGMIIVGIGSVELEPTGDALGPGDFLFATEGSAEKPHQLPPAPAPRGAIIFFGARVLAQTCWSAARRSSKFSRDVASQRGSQGVWEFGSFLFLKTKIIPISLSPKLSVQTSEGVERYRSSQCSSSLPRAPAKRRPTNLASLAMVGPLAVEVGNLMRKTRRQTDAYGKYVYSMGPGFWMSTMSSGAVWFPLSSTRRTIQAELGLVKISVHF